MVTLVAFLLARIAEDETLALALKPANERHPWGDEDLAPVPFDEIDDELRGYLGGPLGEVAAQFAPARVVAECEAKRRIVALHSGYAALCHWSHDSMENHDGYDCETLTALAISYREHPDYRSEWMP